MSVTESEILSKKNFNPMRWDCEKQGCFNKHHRPKLEMLNDQLPNRIAMSDVDGLVEIGGNLLFLEWKSHTRVPLGQQILMRRLTQFSPASVLIVEGDAETMEVESVRIVHEGQFGDVLQADLETLKSLIKQWSDWAREHPVTHSTRIDYHQSKAAPLAMLTQDPDC